MAAAGAGPEPIHQRSLTAEKLADAIRFCLTREAAKAAAAIAAKVRSESGVKAAAASFHSHLPRDDLECDIIKGQPAVWSCSRKRRQLKLSKMAAEILSSHLKVDVGCLEMCTTQVPDEWFLANFHRYESHRIVMEARRWKPVTGTIAAAMGVSADLARSAADTVVRPVKAYQQRDTKGLEDHAVSTTATAAPSSNDQIPRGEKHPRGCLSITKSLTVVSAHSMSEFLKRFASGLVIIPFAFTEGCRNMPLLYGEELRDYGEIYDWKSGIIFGAKAVVFGVVDGVCGLFILPYKGAKQQGAIGAAKGVGKGIAGLSSKLFTGMWDLTLAVQRF